MPVLPLFNTNNTLQGLKRVVKPGRKEAVWEERRSRNEGERG